MRKKLILIIVVGYLLCCLVFLFSGCMQPLQSNNPQLDSWIEITKAAMIANQASAPVNPYVFPIGVGLSGVITMLEALRRKEKSARKHAEHELNGNNKST